MRSTPCDANGIPLESHGRPLEPYQAPLSPARTMCGGLFVWDDYSTTQFISPRGIQNLAYYKYTGKDLSFIGNWFLFDVHAWMAYQLPLWLAPNVITLLGLLCNIVALLLCHAFVEPLFGGATDQRWVYAVAGFLLLSYQALDNMDGKQARRTGSSSALGELFDHVCDASCITVFSMLTAIGGSLDVYWMFAICWISITVFHWAHWEEYYVGELIMGKFNGPTEAILAIVGVLWTTAVFGPEVLATPVYQGYTPMQIGILGMGVAGVCTVFGGARAVYGFCQAQRLSMLGPVIELTPFFLAAAANVVWLTSSVAVFGDKNVLAVTPIVFMLQAGVFIAYLETRLLTQRICRERCPTFYLANVPAIAGALHAYHGSVTGAMLYDEEVVAQTVLLVTIALFTYLVMTTINQLTTALNIYVFRIPY